MVVTTWYCLPLTTYRLCATSPLTGLGFVSQVIDSSLILVTESITHAADLSYVAFLLPFSAELWIALAAVIVFNGLLDYALQRLSPYRYVSDACVCSVRGPIVHLFTSHVPPPARLCLDSYTTVDGPTPSVRSLDHDENHDAGDVCEKSATSSMFVSWYLFTRVDEFEEENWPGRWLNTGYSFLILIFNSTYVANLASAFLVGTSTTTRLLSIDDANSRGSRICAWQVLLERCRVVLAPHTQRSAPRLASLLLSCRRGAPPPPPFGCDTRA